MLNESASLFQTSPYFRRIDDKDAASLHCGGNYEEIESGARLAIREAVMRTYYVFQAKDTPALRGFTDEPRASMLPSEYGPWTLLREIGPDEEWNLDISRAVVASGILENGYYLLGPLKQTGPRPIIESDRVEGTAVYDRNNAQIGTIKRLIIEKVSGRVLYVDVTFGGLFGVGVHHHTIPWGRLTYDTELEGYHTDVTEEQLRDAPVFTDERRGKLDKTREREMQNYWLNLP